MKLTCVWIACASPGVPAEELAPALARTSADAEKLAGILEFSGGNDQFFLTLGMAIGKAVMDPARDIE